MHDKDFICQDCNVIYDTPRGFSIYKRTRKHLDKILSESGDLNGLAASDDETIDLNIPDNQIGNQTIDLDTSISRCH